MKNTFIDSYIAAGHSASLSLKNLYTTKIITNQNHDSFFRVPFEDFFLEHQYELSKIIEQRQIPEYMFYRPKWVSLNYYGTTELWIAILRANDMKNVSEFHIPIINLYKSEQLKNLINIFNKRKKKIR